MSAPRPGSMRLVTSASGKPPKPPFGLRGWSDDAEAAAVLLDPAACDDAAGVARQIPRASEAPPGAPVVVLGAAASAGRFWSRLLGGAAAGVSRSARCGALIARGYVDVGAGIDDATKADLAWGWAPRQEGPERTL